MEWRGRRQSANIEDRRGVGGGRGIALGGGIGTVVIVLIALFLGGQIGDIFGNGTGLVPSATTVASSGGALQDEQSQFVAVVLADTEDFWTREFKEMGYTYRPPKLVLFSGYVQTGSGTASSATGPFYSPADKKVYIDLSFYSELQTRFGAAGDFAQAYVIAHEVGHAVQDQLGILDQVNASNSNEMSVRCELQADFFAGLWGHYENSVGFLEQGDVEEAINAANAIGDDRLQQQSQGRVVPDSFTHGTSAQRVRWFKLGFDTGDINRGDTFSIPYDQL
jgi:predicted metalloprotease